MDSDGGVYITTADIFEKLEVVDSKVDGISADVRSITQHEVPKIADHDKRITRIERVHLVAVGVVAALSGFGGAGLWTWLGSGG